MHLNVTNISQILILLSFSFNRSKISSSHVGVISKAKRIQLLVFFSLPWSYQSVFCKDRLEHPMTQTLLNGARTRIFKQFSSLDRKT